MNISNRHWKLSKDLLIDNSPWVLENNLTKANLIITEEEMDYLYRMLDALFGE